MFCQDRLKGSQVFLQQPTGAESARMRRTALTALYVGSSARGSRDFVGGATGRPGVVQVGYSNEDLIMHPAGRSVLFSTRRAGIVRVRADGQRCDLYPDHALQLRMQPDARQGTGRSGL